MFVCNKETYGYLTVPLRSHNTLQDEADSFMHALLEVNGGWFLLLERPTSVLHARPTNFTGFGLERPFSVHVSFTPFLHPSSSSLFSAKPPSDAVQTHTCS